MAIISPFVKYSYSGEIFAGTFFKKGLARYIEPLGSNEFGTLSMVLKLLKLNYCIFFIIGLFKKVLISYLYIFSIRVIAVDVHGAEIPHLVKFEIDLQEVLRERVVPPAHPTISCENKI